MTARAVARMDAAPETAKRALPPVKEDPNPQGPGLPPEPDWVGQYVRRTLLKGLVALILLVAGMAILGRFYTAELLAVTAWVNEQLGFVGLALLLVLTDAVITPVPPDLLLIVIANTELAQRWWLYVPTLGVISSGAGVLAWYLSSRLGHTRIPTLLFGRFRERNAAVVSRYGALAVALGALTPIPYSVTCWTAGLLHLPLRKLVWATLLRIPRFVGYYLLIAWSTHLLD
ncbi:MAG: VTT domain-containing protein [Polyangiaceae bacterium]|nr:VTT domain-containing protein [Polyangiaceae bacterium]